MLIFICEHQPWYAREGLGQMDPGLQDPEIHGFAGEVKHRQLTTREIAILAGEPPSEI